MVGSLLHGEAVDHPAGTAGSVAGPSRGGSAYADRSLNLPRL